MRRGVSILVATWLGAAGVGTSSRAGTWYWDADGSTEGNEPATGANLGGSGVWGGPVACWWDPSGGTVRAWVDGNEAVFSGTAGAVTVTSVSVSALTFKKSGYSIDGGTLATAGASSRFVVDAGVTAALGSVIRGSNTLVKLGEGTLVLLDPANLNTADASAGGWRIEGGGTLRIMADGSLGAPLPDTARNTVTDLQLNQSTLQAGASLELDINRRTKINTNASTNRGDAIIDTHGHVVAWFGSLQGGVGSLRVINSGSTPGLLILGTDKKASVNPFGSALPAGTVNLTIQGGAIVQTSGQVTPAGGELGSETGLGGGVLAIKLDEGQIRSESGGYAFQRNLILGPGGGSLDTGAWEQTFTGGVSGPGRLSKEGSGTLILDNPVASWSGGTRIRGGTLQLGRLGSNGLLPGSPGRPSTVVISAGATLRFARGSSKSFFDVLSGEGGITVANAAGAAARLVSDNTYTGPTTIKSGTLMLGQGNPGEPGSIASRLVHNNGTLVFNRVEHLTYPGAIAGPGRVEKQGAGRLVLTGTHEYTGDTTVSAGTLVVNGVTGDSAVFVTGGIVGGQGVIHGPVTIGAGGRLAPGVSIGTLTISNSLSLSGVTVMELDAAAGTNDCVRGLTSVTYGGALLLSRVGGTIAKSNVFRLFSAERYHGAFRALSPSTPGPGLVWDTNTLATDGTLRVSSVASPEPVAITPAVSGKRLTLSWPGDDVAWRLEAQTNALSAGLGTNWSEVSGSGESRQVSLEPDPAVGCVFYRLRYP